MLCSAAKFSHPRLGYLPSWPSPRLPVHELHQDRSASRVSGLHCKASAASSENPSPSGADNASSPLATITCRGKQIECRRGTLLRTALLDGGISPHNGQSKLINCRGLGTCGTCAVRIDGPVSPAEKTAKEKIRLNFPPHSAPSNEHLRLACQVTVEGDLDVIKMAGFWGSSADEVSTEPTSEFRKPFGELEYILDTVSKKAR